MLGAGQGLNLLLLCRLGTFEIALCHVFQNKHLSFGAFRDRLENVFLITNCIYSVGFYRFELTLRNGYRSKSLCKKLKMPELCVK